MKTDLKNKFSDSSRFDNRHLLKVTPELMVVGEEVISLFIFVCLKQRIHSRVFEFIAIYVTSFLAFHTKVTVNIGLKEVVRMVTSIPSIRCLCYKPEHKRVKKTTDKSTSLTLSNTKRGTDLGTQVVPFDQTFYPVHSYRKLSFI